jgi:hypothetical protein
MLYQEIVLLLRHSDFMKEVMIVFDFDQSNLDFDQSNLDFDQSNFDFDPKIQL